MALYNRLGSDQTVREAYTMRNKTTVILWLIGIMGIIVVCGDYTYAQELYGYTHADILKHKAFYDDPRPIYDELNYKKMLPAKVYDSLTYDREAMKKEWADVVGFTAPDVVGSTAPDIKPGVYAHTDKEAYAFKDLMIPLHYERFKAGGDRFMGDFATINVVPTRQYYWALPVAHATKEHQGKTRLDQDGYLINSSYISGVPFPRPGGEREAKQIVYNWEKRYLHCDAFRSLNVFKGFDEHLREDIDGLGGTAWMRLHGRVLMEPLGRYDERAKKFEESSTVRGTAYAPRDIFGNIQIQLAYLDADKYHQWMMYIPMLRRIRVLSATDTQDPIAGQDMILDDSDGFSQKISKKHYPYDYKLIGEREYLVSAYTLDGSGYLSSDTKELHEWEFERRPVYIVELQQLDKNYVYSRRNLYIDKETFLLLYLENYDQKDRLYRDALMRMYFCPEMGVFAVRDVIARDFVDTHSTYVQMFPVPTPDLSRDDFDLRRLSRTAK